MATPLTLRPVLLIASLLFLVALYISFSNSPQHLQYYKTQITQSWNPPQSDNDQTSIPDLSLLKYSRVALASTFGAWHYDVLVPVAHTMEKILGTHDAVRLYVETPYKLGDYGFDEVVNRTELFHGKQFSYHTLTKDIINPNLFPDAPGEMIGLVVLGTCEYDMDFWSQQLLEAWDARPAHKKFTIACIVHEVSDERSFKFLHEWTIRGAVRYLTLAEHVSHTLLQHLQATSDTPSPSEYTSLAEYARVDLHLPILPLPDPPRPAQKGTRKLTNAVVQGLMDPKRRDYLGVLWDLAGAIKANPRLWGYLPPNSGTNEFLPDPSDEPFQLHLVGGQGWIDDFPSELRHVVKFHRDLDYYQYYELMQSMDVVLPAFASSHYYDEKASSTVVMAIQCNVPLLVTRRFRASYVYAADDRVTLVRPQALREIHAIQILRAGTSPFSETKAKRQHDASITIDELIRQYEPKMHGRARYEFQKDVRQMLLKGWERSNEDFATFKRSVWNKNKEVGLRMLEDR
ncbi:hypothetical protein FS837_011997 [Tulasnella sp. UAMH 9824]|nr:hypothetical protein FS837_011997 [Tulasnella sp. UAMH 9824]